MFMNATKWPSLTEFAKFLGREGICRVGETDKGIQIAWIDNSPEALRRQDAIRKKERQDRGDEEREQILIREQIQRAKADAEARENGDGVEGEGELKRAEGEKVVLSFGKKSSEPRIDQPSPLASGPGKRAFSSAEKPEVTVPPSELDTGEKTESPLDSTDKDAKFPAGDATTQTGKISLKMGIQSKPKNVFAAAKKNALAGKMISIVEQPKKISEAERIMKEELERKRSREAIGGGGLAKKRQRF
jgi:DNA/RNA-binding protein KIN17